RSIDAIRTAGVPVVSVDIPSGVNASTGEVAGACVSATQSVTFHGEKVGIAVAPGSLRSGRVEVADIGLERAETAHARVTSEIARKIPRRERDGNKYRSGSLLVIGGAPRLAGAGAPAAEAAVRAPAGGRALRRPRRARPVVG